MTRVDPYARSVTIGEPERRTLAEALGGHPEVVAGYLFGSQAAGTAGPLSDVDVGVWLDAGVEPLARHELGIRLAREAGRALHGAEVQVVVLNDAPPLLIHRVLGNKLALVDGDPQARANLESDALIRYLDTMPLREELSRGLEQRMEAGSFGRSTKG